MDTVAIRKQVKHRMGPEKTPPAIPGKDGVRVRKEEQEAKACHQNTRTEASRTQGETRTGDGRDSHTLKICVLEWWTHRWSHSGAGVDPI